jgi:hypothetical protein
MDRIAANLQDHPNSRQIKKLVFAACTGTWENNPQQLAAFDLSTLLGDLTQRYPTLASLKERLFKIVDSLNKKDEYRKIASQFLDHLEPEYLQQDIMGFQSIDGESFMAPESESPTEPFAHESKLKTPTINPQPIASSYLAPEVIHPLRGDVSAPDVELGLPEDWFDIRWEIMKFANPLSVKILLFSIVEAPFAFSHEDWLRLHQVTLDQLLCRLVSSSTSLANVEARLQKMAMVLDQAMPAEHTAPHIGTTVMAIVQALQPLTKLAPPNRAIPSEPALVSHRQ